MQGQDKKYLLKDLLALTLVFGALFFSFLGNRPLAAPDEGRYVEIPREMVATGDYLTPRLNGLKYFEKPPLLYWLQTVPIKLFGIKEWAMRLPLAFLALFGCLITYFFTQRLYGRATGLWTTTILGTSLLYYVLGRLITLDLGVSVFLTGTLFCLFNAIESTGRKRQGLMYLCATFGAAALLSKGLIALALPGAIMLCYLILTNRWSLLKELYLSSSALIFFILAAPWHILASLKNPGFFDFYFIHEHFERYLTTVHRRHQPLWFFLPIIFVGFLPWSTFLFRTLKQSFPTSLKVCRENPKNTFLVLWALVPFVFFSLSHSKLIPYILPIFPPIALLMAQMIQKRLENKQSFKGEIFGYSFLCLSLIVGSLIAILKVEPSLKTLIRTHLICLYSIWGLSAVTLPILRLWKSERAALMGIPVSGILVLITLAQAAPMVPRLSIKPLAEKFLKYMPKDTKVFSYITYYQDLPPYLNRTVQIVNWYGELEFGSKAEPEQTQIVQYHDFQKAWTEDPYVCVFTRQDRYRDLLTFPWFSPMVLGEHDEQFLACNHVPEEALK